jgi:AAA domain
MDITKNPLVINLFAGPGTGKSTSAAQIYSELKWHGINCELVTEFAKDKVWEESFKVLDDQIYIFGKQVHRMRRLIGKVDVIITDSPILNSLIYDETGNKNFHNLIMDVFNEFNNLNFFLRRTKKYQQAGRVQNEEKAKMLDDKIWTMLCDNNIPCDVVDAIKESILTDLLTTVLFYIKNNSKKV